jgi:uncharacterized surface protein with fasciclin (FAS1) repeats
MPQKNGTQDPYRFIFFSSVLFLFLEAHFLAELRTGLSSHPMKRILALAALSAAIGLQSCAGGDQSSKSTSTSDSTGTKKTMQSRVQEIRDSLNTLRGSDASALRFLETDAQYSYWGALVKRSKWSKEIHNGNYTVLAPGNDAMQRYGEEMLGELKSGENQSILDDLVGRHVITTPFIAVKAEGLSELETIGGTRLKIQPGARQIEGVVYSTEQISTQHGSILPIKDLLYFPEEELVKGQKKRDKK